MQTIKKKEGMRPCATSASVNVSRLSLYRAAESARNVAENLQALFESFSLPNREIRFKLLFLLLGPKEKLK